MRCYKSSFSESSVIDLCLYYYDKVLYSMIFLFRTEINLFWFFWKFGFSFLQNTWWAFLECYTLIFSKYTNFTVKALASFYKLCLQKSTKAYMRLKIWRNPLNAYIVLKFKKPGMFLTMENTLNIPKSCFNKEYH